MAFWTLWPLRWTQRHYAKLLSSEFPLKCRRIDYLAKRANDGELTPDEDAEYEALIDGADLITILKLKAQHLLAA